MIDPIIATTISATAGLRPGGADSGHEVLATYRSMAGDDVFALCRNGLLLRGDDGWRYIDNAEIEHVGLGGPETKTTIEGRRLSLKLTGGELVNVPVDGGRGNFLDVFAVHAFVRRRVHQRHALGR